MANTKLITKSEARLEHILNAHSKSKDKKITQIELSPNHLVNQKYRQAARYAPEDSVNQLVEATIQGTTLIGKTTHEYKTLIKLFEFDSTELSPMSELKQRDHLIEECSALRIAAVMEMEEGYNPVNLEMHFYQTPQSIIENLGAMININNGIGVRIYHNAEDITETIEDFNSRNYTGNNSVTGKARGKYQHTLKKHTSVEG